MKRKSCRLGHPRPKRRVYNCPKGFGLMATLDDTAAPVAEKSVESSASAVEWAAIFGGALAAFGVTIILLTLGPGLGP